MENQVSQRVKMLRNELKISQNEFANSISVSSVTVWKMENGESQPSRKTLETICNVYKVSKEWLFNGIGEMTFTEPVEENQKNWKLEAYSQLEGKASHLEKEVEFLRNILTNLTTGKTANFRNGFDMPGFSNKENAVKTVRVAA